MKFKNKIMSIVVASIIVGYAVYLSIMTWGIGRLSTSIEGEFDRIRSKRICRHGRALPECKDLKGL